MNSLSNDHFSKKAFGEINFRSNDRFQKKLSVKWTFGQMNFWSNDHYLKKKSVVWPSGKMNFRSNGVRLHSISVKWYSVKWCAVKLPFGQKISVKWFFGKVIQNRRNKLLTKSRKKLSVKWLFLEKGFGQMTWFWNKKSLKWTFELFSKKSFGQIPVRSFKRRLVSWCSANRIFG
jgi:hypothetical protein